MTAIDRDQALAALKHKDLVVHQDDDGDDHRFDFVYLDSALDALTALPAIPDQDFHCAACGVGVCRHYLEALNAICALPLDEYGAAYDLANDLRAILSGALPAIPLDATMNQREIERQLLRDALDEADSFQRQLDLMRNESMQADRYNSEREGELLEEIEKLRGALPVLETKKETD